MRLHNYLQCYQEKRLQIVYGTQKIYTFVKTVYKIKQGL